VLPYHSLDLLFFLPLRTRSYRSNATSRSCRGLCVVWKLRERVVLYSWPPLYIYIGDFESSSNAWQSLCYIGGEMLAEIFSFTLRLKVATPVQMVAEVRLPKPSKHLLRSTPHSPKQIEEGSAEEVQPGS
jgi:hypothetical protein